MENSKKFYVFYGSNAAVFNLETEARAFAIKTIHQVRWVDNELKFSSEGGPWHVNGLSGECQEDELKIVMEFPTRGNVIFRASLPTTTVLPMISENKDRPYTADYALKKGLVRSELSCDYFQIVKLHTSSYGDWDGVAKVANLGPSGSLWSSSIDWTLNGEIPVHVSAAGRLTVGFACWNDHDHDSEQPNFELKHELQGEVTFFAGQQITFDAVDGTYAMLYQNADFCNAMGEILHRLITEQALKTTIAWDRLISGEKLMKFLKEELLMSLPEVHMKQFVAKIRPMTKCQYQDSETFLEKLKEAFFKKLPDWLVGGSYFNDQIGGYISRKEPAELQALLIEVVKEVN